MSLTLHSELYIQAHFGSYGYQGKHHGPANKFDNYVRQINLIKFEFIHKIPQCMEFLENFELYISSNLANYIYLLTMLDGFRDLTIEHTYRVNNDVADSLSKLALDGVPGVLLWEEWIEDICVHLGFINSFLSEAY